MISTEGQRRSAEQDRPRPLGIGELEKRIQSLQSYCESLEERIEKLEEQLDES